MYKYEYGEDGKMDNYVMFTLSRSPEKNWIDSGQVRLYLNLYTDPKLPEACHRESLDSDPVLYLLYNYSKSESLMYSFMETYNKLRPFK